jgi:hypothetical protein
LAPGEVATYVASFTITQAVVDAGGVSNTVIAAGKDPSDGDVSDTSDDGDDTDGNTEDDPTETDITASPSIALIKTGTFNDEDGDNIADVGETISYAFTVTNTGN